MKVTVLLILKFYFCKSNLFFDFMLFKKGSKLYSIFNNKCPKCNEGEFFVKPNFFRIRKVLAMHENCSQCNLKYMIEPSFFYGALYVNYALTVGIGIVTFAISMLVFELSLNVSFGVIIGVLLLLTPLTIRLSRLIWINIFVKFKKT